jgi:hypothetical protein
MDLKQNTPKVLELGQVLPLSLYFAEDLSYLPLVFQGTNVKKKKKKFFFFFFLKSVDFGKPPPKDQHVTPFPFLMFVLMNMTMQRSTKHVSSQSCKSKKEGSKS